MCAGEEYGGGAQFYLSRFSGALLGVRQFLTGAAGGYVSTHCLNALVLFTAKASLSLFDRSV